MQSSFLSDIDKVIGQGYPQTSDIVRFLHIMCIDINYMILIIEILYEV